MRTGECAARVPLRMTERSEPTEPTAASAPDLAGRTWTCLQKALGHELPNHLTAILGLVRILELEERERLSADGHDYLHRLAAAARRVDGIVKALAELVRAVQEPQVVEPVAVVEAAREA